MAAVPSIGRANRVEGVAPAEADLTRTLYEEYANQIFRYCLHQLGSREEAEDAVQSTFLNAFRGIKRGVVPELESAWLFKIAHNVCLSRRRSSWRRGRIESPADFEVVEELTAAPARRSDELIGLQDVLEQMPESQRRAILLREWQGLSYREIAEELELSQAAVETLIFRARRALASGLEQPPEKQKRVARALDWGNVATAIKSLLVGGSAAAKVAATVAVVSATTVVAAAPVQQHRAHNTVDRHRNARVAPLRRRRRRPPAAHAGLVLGGRAGGPPHARTPRRAEARCRGGRRAHAHGPAGRRRDRRARGERAAARQPLPPEPVAPAAVPATEAEGTVGNGDGTAKEPRNAREERRRARQGCKRRRRPAAAAAARDRRRTTIPCSRCTAAASRRTMRSKSGHWSHEQQGGSNDFGDPVSTLPVTTQPVTPALTSDVQTRRRAAEQERNLSGS